MKLSVIIPVYNESAYLESVINRALDQKLERIDSVEIILVDDGSSDGTAQIVEMSHKGNPNAVKIAHHAKNLGKGAAVKTGLGYASGDIVIIQDADLEYDPKDYKKMVAPILDDLADVVYGSRFSGSQEKRVLYFWHMVGNKLLTLFSNMLSNINLTDMETGYKAFRREVLQRVELKEARFGFEPEITAKIARSKCRIYEVGIAYHGRTYLEGKKVQWKDGVWALWCILKYNLFSR